MSVLLGIASLGLMGAAHGQEQREPIELRFERPGMAFVHATAEEMAASRGAAGFTIVVNFSGGLSASQQAIFSDAAAAWEERITGYQPGAAPLDNTLTIDASGADIDGEGGILGSAGPTVFWLTTNFVVPTEGEMEFDSADLDALETDGALDEVIEHEMGHVIGVGTLWTLNPNSGPPFHYSHGSGEYTGPGGTAEWNGEYGQAGSVDVELEGGPGTANGHWNEVAGGAGLVGITDSQGRDMRDVLMTGWLNTNTFYSSLTHFHLPDIGYTISPYSDGGIFSDGFESGDVSQWAP